MVDSQRIPPQAIEAEQSVLGSILQNTEALHVGIEMLKADYFYLPKHRKIFAAIKHLINTGISIDTLTVGDELAARGQLDDIGRRKYLFDLCDSVVNFANIEDHCNLIIETSIKNEVINQASKLIDEACNPDTPSDNLLDRMEGAVQEGRNRRPIGNKILPLKSLTSDTIERLRKINSGEIKPGLMSGFPDIDRLTLGFQPEDLIIIGARPSVGKTSLARNIIEHIVLCENTGVLLFSVEMARRVIVEQFLCSKARVSHHDLKSGKPIDWDALLEAERLFQEGADILIDGSPSIGLAELQSRAGRMVRQHKIGLVAVDYLQLIIGPESESKRIEIGAISAGLKALARELKMPVVALSQLARLEKGKDRRPEISDLRESGNIEADADVVILIHRKANDHGIMGEEAEIIIAKQRIGPTAVIDCQFRKDTTRFEMTVKKEYTPRGAWNE